jgi:hypothetical protein
MSENKFVRKERIRQDVDAFVKSLEKLPQKELPNAQLSLRSFAHHDEFSAFIQKMRRENEQFGTHEALKANETYARSIFVQYSKACEDLKALEETAANGNDSNAS